jgi:hypothetical protein
MTWAACVVVMVREDGEDGGGMCRGVGEGVHRTNWGRECQVAGTGCFCGWIWILESGGVTACAWGNV